MRKLNIEVNHSVDKAIRILNIFTIAKPALTIEEIIKMSGFPKTTVYRLLYTLERGSLISYDPMTATYKLGLQFFRYFRVLSSSLDIVRVAEPVLTELQEKVGQTVLMSLLEGDSMVYVFKRESEGGLKYSSSVNESKSVTFGVLGKILMAFKPEDYYQTLFEQPFPQLTPHTKTSKEELIEEFKEIKREKIAVEKDETYLGVTGMGAPIFNSEGDVFAAFGVLGPTIHFTPEKIKQIKDEIHKASVDISQKMGYEF